jgi:hypothetical protein
MVAAAASAAALAFVLLMSKLLLGLKRLHGPNSASVDGVPQCSNYQLGHSTTTVNDFFVQRTKLNVFFRIVHGPGFFQHVAAIAAAGTGAGGILENCALTHCDCRFFGNIFLDRRWR